MSKNSEKRVRRTHSDEYRRNAVVTAVLVELSDDWETGKMRYLVFQN